MLRIKYLCHIFLTALFLSANAEQPPAPCGAVPTEQQVKWLRMEWYAFVHFGLNTYTGREWGYGDESPTLFNPTRFDANRIVRVFREAGMSGMIYTAKHHDGWCAWPTRTTSFSIARSPWKKGKGDVVGAFAKACAKQGIQFGVYISPWDRNHAEYGRKGYLNTYYRQIDELLSKYGPVFEIWFDGANGGDGYYGGAREKRSIGTADEYYRFDKIVRRIRRLQPNCIIWGAAERGDVKWGGSEKGHVPYPCWNLIRQNTQEEKWISLEGDTPINGAGWFWHPGQQGKVKSPETLMQVYLDSVGRGANLILNLAPNRDGELDPADVASLMAFGAMRRELLSADYAQGARAEASEVRGNDPAFGPERLVDGDLETYWCPEDGTTQAEVVLTLPEAVTFDIVRLREQIRLGQRVSSFRLEAMQNGEWKVIDNAGQTIGNQVMRKLSEPITTDKVRLVITGARACPCLSEFSLLRLPSSLPRPDITREGGKLHLRCKQQERYHIFYTLDGKKPAEHSELYTAPVPLPEDFCGTVRAVCVSRETGQIGTSAEKDFPLPSDGWKVKDDSAAAAVDGKPETFWHSGRANAVCEVDMGRIHLIRAFSYLPRQDGNVRGMTNRFILEVSEDGSRWQKAARGTFDNLRANPIEHTIDISPVRARYFRFISTGAVEGKGASAAEIRIFAAGRSQSEHQ